MGGSHVSKFRLCLAGSAFIEISSGLQAVLKLGNGAAQPLYVSFSNADLGFKTSPKVDDIADLPLFDHVSGTYISSKLSLKIGNTLSQSPILVVALMLGLPPAAAAAAAADLDNIHALVNIIIPVSSPSSPG
ncbi:hypothetical protein FSARC_13688 [Fusarium sarcochroum]|uniref:Uncharacterized protein n=1 Tax=Fusarium sarcochroum TaxID=1208366 RepID=A0A8H4SZV3_9HYPO|nr:hypothetical protein FSARC_13688 [Fusarium sarcochroum]